MSEKPYYVVCPGVHIISRTGRIGYNPDNYEDHYDPPDNFGYQGSSLCSGFLCDAANPWQRALTRHRSGDTPLATMDWLSIAKSASFHFAA
jgi:hypothetical protein